MQPKRWLTWIVLACLLAMSAAVARDQWLHVYVEEDDGDETVRINVPLNLVETILPLIQGRDLIPLGVEPGPGMGAILKELYQRQLDSEFETRDDGLRAARELVKETKA